MGSRLLFCVCLLLPGLFLARAVVDRRTFSQDDLHQRGVYVVGVSAQGRGSSRIQAWVNWWVQQQRQ